MRYYFEGSCYRVSYNRDDASDFSSSWPCSTVDGSGSFTFDSSGNLCDASGTAAKYDGSDWLAFSEDCQNYGEPRYRKDPRAKALKAKQDAERAEFMRPKRFQFWQFGILFTQTDDAGKAERIRSNNPTLEFREVPSV